MADSKIHDLTDIGSPAATDELYVVGTPLVTPTDRKVQVGNLVPTIKRTVWKNGSDYTTTSTSFVDIDGTNLPALSFTLTTGDLVELVLSLSLSHLTAGNVVLLDWLIDRPISADTSIRALTSTNSAAEYVTANNQNQGINRETAVAEFTATEAGAHTFKPQWAVQAGTAKILQTGGVDVAPIVHRAVRWPVGLVL